MRPAQQGLPFIHRVVPERWYVVGTYGWVHSVCALESYTGPVTLWGSCLFVLSKIALLGDSVFIVLRKQDLSVLHWWHHISTLVYAWYMTGDRQVGTSQYIYCIIWIFHLNHLIFCIPTVFVFYPFC